MIIVIILVFLIAACAVVVLYSALILASDYDDAMEELEDETFVNYDDDADTNDSQGGIRQRP